MYQPTEAEEKLIVLFEYFNLAIWERIGIMKDLYKRYQTQENLLKYLESVKDSGISKTDPMQQMERILES